LYIELAACQGIEPRCWVLESLLLPEDKLNWCAA